MNHYLERLRQEIESAIAGLFAEQWTWHPPGKWCAAEVLEHLYLTYTGTIRGFAKVLEADEPMATRATWTHRGRTLLVLGFGYFPSGRESPPVVRPRGLPPEKVITEIGTKIAEMDEIVSRCEKKFSSRTNLLDHPILGPLTGSQWKKFHWIHGMHHVKQIRSLRESSQGSAPGVRH